MSSPIIAMIGLVLDIVGTLLLAVEAIKLGNFKRLRERLLVPGHWALLPKPFAGSEPDEQRRWASQRELARLHAEPSTVPDSRTSIVQDTTNESSGKTVVTLTPKRNRLREIVLSTPAHLVAGAVVLAIANALTGGRVVDASLVAVNWMKTLPPWFSVPLGLYAVLLTLAALFALGEVVHVGGIWTFRGLVSFVDWIESRTASGVVGITGFVLVLAGFIFQLYANYLQLQGEKQHHGASHQNSTMGRFPDNSVP
jgi:hypothetical protein